MTKKRILIISIIIILIIGVFLTLFFLFPQANKNIGDNQLVSSSSAGFQVGEFPQDLLSDSNQSSQDNSNLDSSSPISFPSDSSSNGINSTSNNSELNQSSIPNPKQQTAAQTEEQIAKTKEVIKNLEPQAKTVFSNNDKLVVTDKLIPEAKIYSPIPMTELKFPLETTKKFYVLRDSEILYLGKGVQDVFELGEGNVNYRLIQTVDITGFSKFYIVNKEFLNPKQVEIYIEKYQVNTLTKIEGNRYKVTGSYGQRDFETKDFELDLFDLIENQLNS